MRTKILAIISGMLLLNSVGMAAQENLPVKRFEFEVKMGPNYPIDSYKGNRNIGGSWGLEARWNMNTPFDIGAEIYWGVADRDEQGENFSYRIFSISTFVDYNFRRGQNVSPFVGIGLGDADCCVLEHQSIGGSSDDGTAIVFTPRVGVELWRHLRLTLDARIARKGYNTIGLSVGYAFGGGLKSKKTAWTQQDDGDISHRQSVFLEIGNASNGVGLNYEHRLKNNPKWGWRIGASWGYSSSSSSLFDAGSSERRYTGSLGLNHLSGSQRSKLELGAGINMGLYNTHFYFWDYEGKENNFGYYFYGTVGWRYQARSGFQFRLGAGPVFSFGGKHGLGNAAFCPYLSVGWAF